MNEQKGFREVTIPARTYKTCDGCLHLGTMKTFFGHNDVKGSFYCIYPDAGGDLRFSPSVDTDKYVYLGYGSIGDSKVVPPTCPYLKKEENAPDRKNEGETA